MTVYLNTDEEMLDGVELGLKEQALRAAQTHVPISLLSPEERNRIERGIKAAEIALFNTKKPQFNDRLDSSKCTLAPVQSLKRVSAVADSTGITPSKNKLTSILTPSAANSSQGKKAKNHLDSRRDRPQDPSSTKPSKNQVVDHTPMDTGVDRALDHKPQVVDRTSMDTSTDRAVDHMPIDTITETIEEPNDEYDDLVNGTSQLGIKQALLEHELASPADDASMVDYLDRSDAQFTTNYEVAVKAATPFPNLAREIMNLGLAMEKYHTENKLGLYKKQGDECKAKIDLLLKLSAELPKMNSGDESYQLKEETKLEITRIVHELRAQGIDIFPRSKATTDPMEIDNQAGAQLVDGEIREEFTKEQLAAASSLINHYIDKFRTTLQELFTTKIAVSIQFLSMMIEVMRKVSDLDDRQKRKALELR